MKSDRAYEALVTEQRELVDEALAAGELRGPIVLRQVERDVARTRLSRSGFTRASRAVWWSLAVALLVVVLVLAPSRPPWLLVASVLALAGAAVLDVVIPSVHALDPDEQRRLKSLTKAPLGY